MVDNRRFKLNDSYKGNFTVCINDELYDGYDEMFITEVVYELNRLNDENKDLKNENYELVKVLNDIIYQTDAEFHNNLYFITVFVSKKAYKKITEILQHKYKKVWSWK